MEEVPLTAYGTASSQPSPVARMMSAFAADFRDGVDINLGVGYVNESTIPRELIAEATAEVLTRPDRFRQPLNYGGPIGSENLIRAVRRFHADHAGRRSKKSALRDRRIIIGPNGATSLLDGLAQLLGPGIVVTADPVYYIYINYLRRRGFDILAVPEDKEGIRLDRLAEKIDRLGPRKKEIRFFYVVTISNPTCTILSTPRKAALIDLATRLSGELGRKVPVVLDRAYEELIHDPAVEQPACGAAFDRAGIVYEVSTLSKILAPGLRIGYLIGPKGPLMRAMVQRTSDTGFSAPPVNQAVAAWLMEHHLAEQIARVKQGYRLRARRIRRAIEEHLGDALADCTGGQAGFYFYLTFRRVETHKGSPLFRFLSRTTGQKSIDGQARNKKPRVVYIPGQHCVDPGGDLVELGRRQMRLSYGYEDPERIEQGIELISQAVDYAES